MMTPYLTLTVALALAVSPLAAIAQASAPPPNAAASGPRAAKPAPQLLTPAQKRDSATAPGDLRPERPVTPQITIPLGKKPPASLKSESQELRRGNAASSGGVDDAAARCEAQSDERERAACRAKRARESRSR